MISANLELLRTMNQKVENQSTPWTRSGVTFRKLIHKRVQDKRLVSGKTLSLYNDLKPGRDHGCHGDKVNFNPVF